MKETQVITGKVRFSYLNVFEPKAAQEGGKEKYSVSLLIPKDSKDTLKRIKKAIDAAAEEGKATKFGNKDPKKISRFKWPLRDGDEERDEDENYAGMMFVNASTDMPPGIVDRDRNEIVDKFDIKSGDWGRADINFYAFNVSGNVGIACGLNNLQLLQEGESLGGARQRAEDAFDDDYEDEDDIM